MRTGTAVTASRTLDRTTETRTAIQDMLTGTPHSGKTFGTKHYQSSVKQVWPSPAVRALCTLVMHWQTTASTTNADKSSCSAGTGGLLTYTKPSGQRHTDLAVEVLMQTGPGKGGVQHLRLKLVLSRCSDHELFHISLLGRCAFKPAAALLFCLELSLAIHRIELLLWCQGPVCLCSWVKSLCCQCSERVDRFPDLTSFSIMDCEDNKVQIQDNQQ